ncbi:predicted protein [Aspergillus terreus NIH2624]|uniref:Uncharacterized protein n=1 Tax=Aspergillus terreus (strain NIH 2624 / FGSC A1156) TaxID=341663 RepID=Q0CPI4_ASPTN|nr:uncharacterized protein ATEG_04400 [Aspergillus terreus NIH2624]EAU34847.1 predicted protein [Aspergillus terreus NIH2624]
MPSPILSVPAAPPAAADEPVASLGRKRFDKRPLSMDPAIAILDVEYNELLQSWKEFKDHLAPADRLDLHDSPQTEDDVVAVVRGIQALWMSSPRQRLFTRSMTLCDQFLSTLDPHAILLQALPNYEANRSLFYAVLQSILKACANYPNLIEGILKAFTEVNGCICAPTEDGQSSGLGLSTIPIARFYSTTFFFLGQIMEWYNRGSACGLLKSLSQDVYLHLRGLIYAIQRRAKDIVRGTSDDMDLDNTAHEPPFDAVQLYDNLRLWEEARLNQIGLADGVRRWFSATVFTRQVMCEIQIDYAQRALLRSQRGALLAQMLESASQRLRPVTQQNSGIACLTTTAAQDLGMPDGHLETEHRSQLTKPSSQDMSRFKWSHGLKHKYTRSEMQARSKHLLDFFDSDDQVADCELDVEVNVEDSVMVSLQQWASNAHSQVLAVGGAPTTVFPSPVALISACYVSLARKEGLPVVSHFCSLPTHERDGMTVYEQALIALAYSLLRQLIDCLPPVLEGHAACDLSPDRFKPLDGTLTSWKEVLSLIDILLHYAPPLVVCVIDGLDVIQHESTDLRIRSLVRILLAHTRHEPVSTPEGGLGQSVLLKILFTVAGRPSSLVETMSENHLVLSESNRSNPPAATDQPLNPDVGVVMMNA